MTVPDDFARKTTCSPVECENAQDWVYVCNWYLQLASKIVQFSVGCLDSDDVFKKTLGGSEQRVGDDPCVNAKDGIWRNLTSIPFENLVCHLALNRERASLDLPGIDSPRIKCELKRSKTHHLGVCCRQRRLGRLHLGQ